jgi:hypothetical protein
MALTSANYLTERGKEAEEVSFANQDAFLHIVGASPRLVGVGPASKLVPGMRKDLFLHSGPCLKWDQMTGAMRGAAIGAVLYERLAENEQEALSKLEKNELDFDFESAHDHGCVSPMAGMISYTTPVFMIENSQESGKKKKNYSFSPINEGVGKVKTLRYGAYSPDVIKRLEWIRDILAPNLNLAIKSATAVAEEEGGVVGVDLKQIICEALRRGDECHNRNKSATSIFFKIIAPHLVRESESKEVAAEILEFIGANDHFFLNLSMAASKATLDSAHGIKNSTVLTGMSSNGHVFGIRVSGLGSLEPPYDWFTAPSPYAHGRYFEGYTKQDANQVLGDSYVSECVGLGAFAMAASPAITEFIGGTPRWAEEEVKKMMKITWGKNPDYVIPYMNYQGTPTAIDLRKVIRSGVLPILNTGIAHKRPGVGQIGAGIFRAPMKCFQGAESAWRSKQKQKQK